MVSHGALTLSRAQSSGSRDHGQGGAAVHGAQVMLDVGADVGVRWAEGRVGGRREANERDVGDGGTPGKCGGTAGTERRQQVSAEGGRGALGETWCFWLLRIQLRRPRAFIATVWVPIRRCSHSRLQADVTLSATPLVAVDVSHCWQRLAAAARALIPQTGNATSLQPLLGRAGS